MGHTAQCVFCGTTCRCDAVPGSDRCVCVATLVQVKDGRKVVLHPTSVLFRYSQTAPWVVYHDVQLTTEEHMREVVAIKPTWLTELAPQYYEAKDKRKQGHQSTKRKARDAMLPPRTAGILGLLAAEEAEIRGGAGDGRSRTRASGKRMRSVF